MHSLNAHMMRQLMARFFSALFYIFSIAMAVLTIQEFWHGLNDVENAIGAFVKSINTAVIALAIFELGNVVSREYGSQEEDHIVIVIRRTVPRFVSITCIALVLEGLLLVIKYSQLEMAGNLYYPVAIIIAASLLLIALGFFLRSTATNESPEESQSCPQSLGANGHVPLQHFYPSASTI